MVGATGSAVTADGAGLVERPDDAPLRVDGDGLGNADCAVLVVGVVVVVVAADVDVCPDDDVIAADPVGVNACSVFEHDAAASPTTTVARINERRGRPVRIVATLARKIFSGRGLH